MPRRPQRILICTHNAHKLEELSAMLADFEIEVLSPHAFPELPEPEETGDSFLANALIKVDAAFAHTGVACLADDSGLVVPALHGEPGVHSARYAGVAGADRDRANRQKLITEIKSLPPEQRQAYFHCSLVLRTSADHYEHFEGRCHGVLLEEERGEHGFGYDPIFLLPDRQQTLAQLLPAQKNLVSHRAQAVNAFRLWLKNRSTF